MSTLGGRTYLVFGQNFQGGYNLPVSGPTGFTQIYSDEIQSFKIVHNGTTLAIKNYAALRDPTNFRRRDGNMGGVVEADGQEGLAYYGGVFTPGATGTAYFAPILIGSKGTARVKSNYQQFFDQYSTANISLFDRRKKAMDTIFMGGISVYDDSNGVLTETPPVPGPGWVDDVSTWSTQERLGSRIHHDAPPRALRRLFGRPGQSVLARVRRWRHQSRQAQGSDRPRLHLRRDLFDGRPDELESGHRGDPDRRLQPGLPGDPDADLSRERNTGVVPSGPGQDRPRHVRPRAGALTKPAAR